MAERTGLEAIDSGLEINNLMIFIDLRSPEVTWNTRQCHQNCHQDARRPPPGERQPGRMPPRQTIFS
jgi:hypothetical protein